MKKISEINEGLWDGIVNRGTTGDVRREDSIDSLGEDDFYNYLEKNYQNMGYEYIERISGGEQPVILIPVCMTPKGRYDLECYYENDRISHILFSNVIMVRCEGCRDILKRHFVKDTPEWVANRGYYFSKMQMYKHKDKDYIPNSLFIKFLDTLLEETELPVGIKKRRS